MKIANVAIDYYVSFVRKGTLNISDRQKLNFDCFKKSSSCYDYFILFYYNSILYLNNNKKLQHFYYKTNLAKCNKTFYICTISFNENS